MSDLLIFITAKTPINQKGLAVVQVPAVLKASEIGSVHLLEQRLNAALRHVYALEPNAVVTSFSVYSVETP
jgi:hypothetical protein